MSSGKKNGSKPPKNPNAAIEAALLLLRNFLTDREPDLPPERVLSQVAAGGKTIDLDRESMANFHELKRAFDRYAELSRTLTLRSVQRSVEHAIVSHFDDGDVAATVKALRDDLSKPAKTFTVEPWQQLEAHAGQSEAPRSAFSASLSASVIY